MKKQSFNMYRDYVHLLRDNGVISYEVSDVLFRFGLYMSYCDADEECVTRIMEYLALCPVIISSSGLKDGLYE